MVRETAMGGTALTSRAAFEIVCCDLQITPDDYRITCGLLPAYILVVSLSNQ